MTIDLKSFVLFHRLDKCKLKWNYIPSKESIQYTMHRLIGAALLLDKVKYLFPGFSLFQILTYGNLRSRSSW
jgi:hypothetical protein